MRLAQRVLIISAIGLMLVIAGCGAMSQTEPQSQQRNQRQDSVLSSGGIKWDNAQPEGGRTNMVTSTLGVDKAPRIDEEVLSRGIIAVRQQGMVKIFSAKGELLAQGSFADPTSPLNILGFSPEGEHRFMSAIP